MTTIPFTAPVILLLAFCLLVGLSLGGLLVRAQWRKQAQQEQVASQQQLEEKHSQWLQENESLAQANLEAQQQHQNLLSQQSQLQHQLGQWQQQASQLPELEKQIQHWQQQYQQLQSRFAELQANAAATEARMAQEKVAAEEKIQLLSEAEQRLQGQFENLANKIFEQKQATFSQASQKDLSALLTPLKEQIDGFKQQISDQYVKEGQERTALKTEILSLKALNQQITEEAAALTKALKGDNKQQGNWGELVLETVLQESGLREGHEYETQVSLKSEQGKALQPDVVVHLPNEKDVIIDSKVSLAAYERYFNEEDDTLKQAHLKAHISSLQGHIKGLGKKEYHDLPGLRSLDYVLMFIPIEPAFMLAVEQEPKLIQQALDNNIMLVSPTNLLVALRTIHNIWRYEYQNQNAQVIADKAGKMYDKFAAFVTDMQNLGTSLQTVQKRYDTALNKLSEGRGNLIRQAEQFRELGVKTSKRLPVSGDDEAAD